MINYYLKNFSRLLLLLIAFIYSGNEVNAQLAEPDLNFNIQDPGNDHGNGFRSEQILAIEELDNGNVLIGGNFSSYGEHAAEDLIMLDENGEAVPSFNISLTGMHVRSICRQNDGRILVGGSFWVNNTSLKNFIRLNADGTLDESFDLGNKLNGEVWEVIFQDDGKMLLLGGISSFDGVSRRYLLRLNQDLTLDETFNSGYFQYPPRNIAITNEGKIILAGGINEYDGIRANIIRLNQDGSLDTSFQTNTQNITSMALQNDGKILIGGNFGLTRLNADGSSDASFSDYVPGSQVIDIAIQDDGKIIAGKNWNLAGYYGPFKGIARLNTDGTPDTSFNPGEGFNNSILLLTLLSDGKIMTHGYFSEYDNYPQSRLSRLNPDGSRDETFYRLATGFNDNVTCLAVQDDGKIIAAGAFNVFNEAPAGRIARLNQDGTRDISFNMGMGFDNTVNALKVQDDGKILVGGQFTSYNGAANPNLVRLLSDGSLDTTFKAGSFSISVEDIEIQSDGKIIVAGNGPYTHDSYSSNFLVRINPDGSPDLSFSVPSISGMVNNVEIADDGKIYLTGYFHTINGAGASKIARLHSNGGLDNTFSAGSGFYMEPPETITIQADGKILAAGTHLREYNGSAVSNLIRINTDGSLDNTFNVTQQLIYPRDIKLLENGDILLAASEIYFFNPDGLLNSTISFNSPHNVISTLCFDQNRNLLAGGTFTYIKNRLTRLFLSTKINITSAPSGYICAGGDISVGYTSMGFSEGDEFLLELSDKEGNFQDALIIGQASMPEGTIQGIIPEDIAPGQGYRVRISSATKYIISQENGSDLRIQNVIFPDPEPVFYNDPPVVLSSALPTGGVYEGTGISDGVFYPEVATSGVHTITYTYQFSESCIITKENSITVNKATPQISAQVYDITYGQPIEAGFEITPDVEGNIGFNPPAGAIADAGSIAVEIIFTPSDTLNYNSTTQIAQLTINKAPLVITADNKTISYNGEFFTGFTVSYNGFVADEGQEVLNGELSFGEAETAINAGSHSITPSGLSSGNYDITFVSGLLEITPAPLIITAEDKSMVYNTESFSAFTVSYNGFVAGEGQEMLNGELSFGEAETAVNADSYSITPSGLSSGNYDISFVSGLLEITPAPLSITAEDKSMVYNAGSFNDFTVSYNGFVVDEGQEVLSGMLTFGEAETAVDAGTYNITPAGLTSGNYDISFVSGLLEITPAPLAIVAEDKSMVYNAESFSAFTVSYNGFVAGESQEVLSGELSFGEAETAVNAGIYNVTPAGLSSGNYDISFVSGQLEITPANLNITAADATKEYGSAADFSETGFTTEGLFGADNVISVNYSSEGEAENADIGSYTIEISNATGNGLENYNIMYSEGSLVVSPLTVVITGSFSAEDKVYDGTVSALISENNLSLFEIVEGDQVFLSDVLVEFTDAQPAQDIQVNIVSASLSGEDSPNYLLSLEDAPTDYASIFLQTFSLLIEITPENSGTVTGEGDYEEGETVQLQAQAAEGFVFVEWTDQQGNSLSNMPDTEFSMPAHDIILKAVFQSTVSINETGFAEVIIYPNPAHSDVNISSESTIKEITVTDMNGRNVLKYHDVDSSIFSINISQLDSGIYLIKAVTNKGISVNKLQVK